MSVEIDLEPVSSIILDLGLSPNGRAQKFFVNTCYRHMDKYVPMREGNLRTIVTLGENYIDYEMPYAHYQYVGMREDGSYEIKKHTTPGTTTYWDERMWAIEKNDIINEMQDFIERG